MKTTLFFGSVVCGVLLMSVGCGLPSSEAPNDETAQAAIRTVLHEQVDAWNRGDVEAFMDGYARTDSLRFASGGTVHQGWHAALARYRRAYPDRAAMGTLAFRRLDIRVLASRTALVFGTWELTRADDAPHGLFTLVFRRYPQGWRIVHDHTSSAP